MPKKRKEKKTRVDDIHCWSVHMEAENPYASDAIGWLLAGRIGDRAAAHEGGSAYVVVLHMHSMYSSSNEASRVLFASKFPSRGL